MKKNEMILLVGFFLVTGCNNGDTKVADKKIPDGVSVSNSNLFEANINGAKTVDKSPLIIFKKATEKERESLSISGVFNELNSHIGLVVVNDTGNLSAGKYMLQQNAKKTTGRYETNINGGSTDPENTLYKATGTVTVINIDTMAKKITADVDMYAINKIKEKVHISAHVNSSFK
jgi:hypothetical protein